MGTRNGNGNGRYTNGNGNGNGLASYLPTLIGTMTILLGLAAGFWAVASPKDDLKRIEWRLDQIEIRQRDDHAVIARHDEVIRATKEEQSRRTDTYVRTDKYTDAHIRLEKDLARIQAQMDSVFPTAKVFDQIDGRLKRLEEWGRVPTSTVTIQPAPK